MSLAKAGVDPSRWDELALADERTQLTWNALDPIINRTANALSSLDYSERRIAVFATNSAETVITYVACLEVGVSSVPVSYHLTAAEVIYILRDSGAVALFVGPETVDEGLAAAAEAGVTTVVGWRCPARDGLIP